MAFFNANFPDGAMGAKVKPTIAIGNTLHTFSFPRAR